MKTYRLQRQGNVPLEFTGWILADETSRQDNQPRWTDLRIYATDTGRYVIESIGRSTIPGETDRPVVAVADQPSDVREALLRTPRYGKPYLTSLAIVALTEAATHDHELKAALTEVI